MLLTTNPPMAYWRTMMPKTNESPPMTATRMSAKIDAWTSCRRNRAVGRRAAHRDRARSGEDVCDPESWAMVRSDMRGRSGTPLTFAAREESLTIGPALSRRGSRSGRAFGGLRREAPRRARSGGRERSRGGRGAGRFRSRGPRTALVRRRAFVPGTQAFDPGYGGGLAETNADAFVVDIPDPWEAVGTAAKALGPCGHFASYSPNVEQVNRTVAALRAGTFVELRTVEIIEREIEASESGTHPSFAPLGHTGYLTFARAVLETL